MLRSYIYRYYRPLILLGLYVSLSAKMRIATGESFIGSDTGSTGIKAIFNNVYSDFGQIASLLGGSAYIAGLIFTVAAMFKVKQHRDNPTQVSISHALIFLLAGIGLIFLPSTLQQGATTIFTSIDSGYAGVSTTNIDNNPWAKPGVQN
jgi:intracellular multiplication protein IcmD